LKRLQELQEAAARRGRYADAMMSIGPETRREIMDLIAVIREMEQSIDIEMLMESGGGKPSSHAPGDPRMAALVIDTEALIRHEVSKANDRRRKNLERTRTAIWKLTRFTESSMEKLQGVTK